MNNIQRTIICILYISSCFLPSELLGEGSIDLIKYPGRRLFYNAEQAQQLKVYARTGEFINFGASHVGITGGFIKVYRPDGTLFATYDDTGATAGLAIINNDVEELNGPTGGGSLNGKGYKPGVLQVGTNDEGIWTFVLGFPSYKLMTFKNLYNGDPWNRLIDQPTIQRVILSWDITVSKNLAANNGGQMLKGRVFSQEYISIVNENANFTSPKFYVLSEAGYQYKIDFYDTDPWGFPLSCNNRGLTDSNKQPLYKSLKQIAYTKSADPSNWIGGKNYLYDPQAQDNYTFVNNKVFFNLPDPDMPAYAKVTDVFRNNTYLSWLFRQPVVTGPVVDEVKFTPGNPNGNGCPLGFILEGDGGTFTFNVNTVGSISLLLDLNNDGDFTDAEDRNYFLPVLGGKDTIYWDGKFGNGQVIPAQNNFVFSYKIIFKTGEVHIMMADIENNPGGVTITRINGPNNPVNEFYYDHSLIGGPVSGGGTPGNPQPTSIPFSYNKNFGNEKMLDYWSYVESAKNGAASFNIVTECKDLYPDSDGDGITDNIDLDDDNDGIADYLEFCAPDSNFVCLPGMFDPSHDEDHDYILNYLDANDPAINNNCPDSNGDGACDVVPGVYDLDGDGVPNHLDLDAENDGVADIDETGFLVPDADRDGVIDFSPGAFGTNGFYFALSTDKNSPTATSVKKPSDKDMDGVPDHDDRDSDNDGIFDLVEAGFFPGFDGNNDGGLDDGTGFVPPVNLKGLLKYIDPAFTGKGISFPPFSDDDEIPDFLDRDSDNDGINDVAETPNPDSDNDGVIGTGMPVVNKFGVAIKDANGNNLFVKSNVLDSNGDGIPNYLDLDSDGDGIADVLENGGSDPDMDKILGTSPVLVNTFGQPINSADGSPINSTSVLQDLDADGIPDYIDLDSDGDMIADFLECPNGGPCKDSDMDGVPDVNDLDSDNDGIFDISEYGFNQFDQNNDGFFDGIATFPQLIGINGFPKVIDPALTGNAYPVLKDQDNDGIPDYIDLDSDNDGIHDVFENFGDDKDNNGVLGTDPVVVNSGGIIIADSFGPVNNSTSILADKDKDGIPNQYDLDSDNDGLTDVQEALFADKDGDGRLDILPSWQINNFGQVVDQSGNIIPGSKTSDADNDGYPNSFDNDSDNDGIYDIVEGSYQNFDSDGDGMIDDGNGNPPAVGTNGYADVIDPVITGIPVPDPGDWDGDGVPDYIDLDSDNDGVKDAVECFYADPDNDGMVGASPLSVSFCGVPLKDNNNTGIIYSFLPKDSDGDGTANYKDHDSDGDGLNDVDEAGYADPDKDGIVGAGTAVAGSNGLVISDGSGNSVNTSALPWDHDADGVYDFMDLDSDGDAISDHDECPSGIPCKDKDGDGVTDIYDLDSDNDGISDLAENCLAQFDGNMDGRLDDGTGAPGTIDMSGIPVYVYPYLINGKLSLPKDSDGDGIPNHNDLDSDNDGINDVGENGLTDPDNDGIIGAGNPPVDLNGLPGGGPFKPIDTDSDGKPNFIDQDSDGDGINDTYEGGIIDPDGDGVAGTGNPVVNSNGQPVIDVGGNEISNTSNPPDFDGDGNPDFTDKDSDNDGIDDGTECPGGAPCPDTDGDGSINGHDLDSDGDDLPDDKECPDGAPCPDGDNDGIPEWIDFNCNGNWIPAITNLQKFIQLCEGENLNVFGNNLIPVPGNIIYSWDGPAGFNLIDTSEATGPFPLILPNINESQEGIYTLSLLTEKGCTAAEDFYLNIGVKPPTPLLTTENNPVCPGESMTLFTNPAAGQNLQYKWYFKNPDGSVILIDSSQWATLIIPKEEVHNSGEYFVEVNSDGCYSGYSNIVKTMIADGGVDLVDEFYTLKHSPGIQQFNILLNDTITGTPNIYYTNIPKDLIILNSNNGLITIDFPTNAGGFYTLDYATCSIFCPEQCDTASLRIFVEPADQEPLDSICDFPNIFTPNEDGNNDSFEIPCLEKYKDNKIQIFNRWGDIVHEKSNYQNDWKGTYRNNPLPAGTYYYLLTIPELKKVFSGFITLIR